VHVNHMPYMPFPPTWPVYIPKDMLANWFESYVDALELNFWTGTELVSGSYDDARRQWNVTLRRSDGSERVMHPRHLIFATGVSSIPYTPDLPWLDAFAGAKVHSGDFKNAEQWKGRKALVLGTGTSGHDVAQELHAQGADVTIIQRSKTYVVSLKEAQSVYAIYSEGIPFGTATCWRLRFLIRCCNAPISFRPPKAARSTRRCSRVSKNPDFGCTSAKTRPASR
jgi:cation diffusion facilitator CzcD-associated flavoprotein CzcO